MLEFRVLGPLQVAKDGRLLPLGGSKQRAVLAQLLLQRNRVVARDLLVDAVWGERPPQSAANSIQIYVSALRRLLADGGTAETAIITERPGYRLRVPPGELDVDQFVRLLSDGERELAAGSFEEAESTLARALAIWRGPALADFSDEVFAQPEIARLEALRLQALNARFEAMMLSGRQAEAVGELQALVGVHPLDERLRAQLMVALYRAGRQAEALDAYQDGRRALVDELGIEPSQPLRELEQAILQQAPSLDVPSKSIERAEATEVSSGIFVGREAELEEILAGLDAAVGGRGRVVLLAGEPGIGKSRLTHEVNRHARARGAAVLVGRCWEAGGAPVYWPWVQSLRQYIEQTDPEALRTQLGAGAADIGQLLPELRDLFPDLPEPPMESEVSRFRLFDSTARFLRNAAAARPLVLVLDDLHAADQPSLLLLRFIAGELSGSRILVVGAYRDVDPTVRDPLASTLAELAREEVTHRIELAGLTALDVGRYVELSVGTTPSTELVAAIHAETDGNPLFVGEVMRLIAARGSLAEVDTTSLWTLGVPQGVREVIGHRLAGLSEECTNLLTLAAVLGRDFGLEALVELSKLSGDELLEILDEAVTARLLAPVPGARGRLRFAHALIRETLYDQLTIPRRVQLHRRAGEALEALYAQDPESHLAELAYHFFEAAPGGDGDRALVYSRRAGDRALRLLAYEEAARLYGLALQTLELQSPVESVARCELLLALGDALAKAGSTHEFKEAFLACADLARTSGLPEYLARAALGYGGRFSWLRAGSDTALVPLLEEALAALGTEESALTARLLARLAGALRDQPSLEPRSSLSRRAVEISRQLGDHATLVYALLSLWAAGWGPETDELVAIADELSQLGAEASDAEWALQAGWLYYATWMTLGETARAATLVDEHRALAEALKQPEEQWYCGEMRSYLSLFRGEFSEAEQLAEEALRIGQRMQPAEANFTYRVVLFVLRREQGRLGEIEDLIRRSVDEYPGYRLFRCLLALLRCELGRKAEARLAFDELATSDFGTLPRDIEWVFCLCILAEVAASIGDRERAGSLYGLLLPYAGQSAVAAAEVPIGSVARYLGILASTTLQWDDAAWYFENALEMNDRMGARPWLAHTQHDYARMLLARNAPGDRDKSRLLLDEALSTYQQLGMPAAAATASALKLGELAAP